MSEAYLMCYYSHSGKWYQTTIYPSKYKEGEYYGGRLTADYCYMVKDEKKFPVALVSVSKKYFVYKPIRRGDIVYIELLGTHFYEGVKREDIRRQLLDDIKKLIGKSVWLSELPYYVKMKVEEYRLKLSPSPTIKQQMFNYRDFDFKIKITNVADYRIDLPYDFTGIVEDFVYLPDIGEKFYERVKRAGQRAFEEGKVEESIAPIWKHIFFTFSPFIIYLIGYSLYMKLKKKNTE